MRLRARQEIGKRVDLVAAIGGFGLRNAPRELGGKFFFQPKEIPERVSLLRQFLPAQVSQIIGEADGICRHRFDLLGYSGLEYGEQIDWHLDAVHGKRAPRRPWYWIDYLNFAKVGDHKVIWELNRHQHLVTLAKAWRLTGETRYVAELEKQWRSWQAANRYPIGINWASSLEVAFRSLSWLWVANLLTNSEVVSKDFLADLVGGLAISGRHIERNLSTYFSPNTHLLGEGVGLFFIGTLCPKLPNAGRWKETGWGIIVEASKRQVRSDGVYFEQALHYHVYALDFFLHARTLAARNGIQIPGELDAVIQKMLDVVAALSQAGPAEAFGDDDGGRVFDPRRNRTEHMTDSLALGAALYEGKYGAKLTEEAVWLFGKRAAEVLQDQERARICSQAFPVGGLYVLTSEEPCPQQMVVDAGPQGTGRSGHGHADALSISMAVDGERFLVDPGTCVYISDSNDRDIFRGTGAHSTLCVDERDQATAAGPFAWTDVPNVCVERWVSGKSFDFISASHDGYSHLPAPVLHRRFVFRIGGLWLVRDVCEGHGRHLLESFWHFADDTILTHDSGAVIATSPKGPHLVFLNAHNSGFREEIGSGLVSQAYGIKNPAPMVRISARTEMPAESAVLMLGQRDAIATGEFTQLMSPSIESPRAYRYTREEAVEEFLFSRAKGSWAFDNWKSDAEFLYCRTEKSRPKLLVLIHGSFVKWQDETLVSERSVVERREWSDAEGKESKHIEKLATTGKSLERVQAE